MFKDSIGTTPVDYINGVRVNHALRLLTMTDTPVNEIADMTGFSNPNYFHKIFKSYMTTSLLAYRKTAIK
jgi:transcriptional regulator GlxA family with amidase domain